MPEFVIFAAGLGSRIGLGLPKCLLKVCGKTILQYQLESIEKLWRGAIVHIISGYQFNAVKAFLADLNPCLDVRLHRNPFYENGILGTAWLAAQWVSSSDVIRIDGDIIFSPKTLYPLMETDISTILYTENHIPETTGVLNLNSDSSMKNIVLEDNYIGEYAWTCIERYTNNEYTQILELAIEKLPLKSYFFEALNLYYNPTGRIVAKKTSDVFEIDTLEDKLYCEEHLGEKKFVK